MPGNRSRSLPVEPLAPARRSSSSSARSSRTGPTGRAPAPRGTTPRSGPRARPPVGLEPLADLLDVPGSGGDRAPMSSVRAHSITPLRNPLGGSARAGGPPSGGRSRAARRSRPLVSPSIRQTAICRSASSPRKSSSRGTPRPPWRRTPGSAPRRRPARPVEPPRRRRPAPPRRGPAAAALPPPAAAPGPALRAVMTTRSRQRSSRSRAGGIGRAPRRRRSSRRLSAASSSSSSAPARCPAEPVAGQPDEPLEVPVPERLGGGPVPAFSPPIQRERTPRPRGASVPPGVIN